MKRLLYVAAAVPLVLVICVPILVEALLEDLLDDLLCRRVRGGS